jgi:hypothetical protein
VSLTLRWLIGLQVVKVSMTDRCVLPKCCLDRRIFKMMIHLQLASDIAGAGSGVMLARFVRFGLSLLPVAAYSKN